MTKKIFASFNIFFLLFAASWGNSKPLDKKDIYLASCYVLNSDFEIVRQLSPDWVCQVKPDGGWLAANKEHLVNYDPEGSVIWKKAGDYHHQIKLWNDKSILVLTSEVQKEDERLMRFDVVQMLRLDDGRVLHQFSLFNEIHKTRKLKNTILDEEINPFLIHKGSSKESTLLGKSHWNTISIHNNEIIINEINGIAFILDEKLQFVRFVPYPKISDIKHNLKTHDFQILGKDHFLFFSNYNKAHKTFNVFEVKDGSLVFEFPKKKVDFEPVWCCGGVQKFEQEYLVGFPAKDDDDNSSIVGLISKNGTWLIKKKIPTRIQDIRKIPYIDFLKKNKIR